MPAYPDGGRIGHENTDSGNLVQFGLKPLDNVIDGHVVFIERTSPAHYRIENGYMTVASHQAIIGGVMAPGAIGTVLQVKEGSPIVHAVVESATDAREKLNNAGISLQNAIDGFLVHFHGVKGNSLIGFRGDGNPRGVAIWQEAFGDFPELPCCSHQDQKAKCHYQNAVSQRPAESPSIDAEGCVQDVFQCAIQPSLPALTLRPQVALAKHGAECDRNHPRNQDRGDDDHGKFMKEAAKNTGHEKHWQEDYSERQSHRKNREVNFL